MNIPTAIEQLEQEWEQVEAIGFFGNLRYGGVFDVEGFERVKAILDSIELPESETLDKRFVEVTWFIPTFMHWQQEEWRQDGKDTRKLDQAITFFEQRLTTILGLP